MYNSSHLSPSDGKLYSYQIAYTRELYQSLCRNIETTTVHGNTIDDAQYTHSNWCVHHACRNTAMQSKDKTRAM